MAFLSEAQLETALLGQLAALQYACISDDLIGPDSKQPERESYDEVVLKTRFTTAIALLNPSFPPEAQADAVRRVIQSEMPNLLDENHRLHRLLTEGVDVEYYAEDGTLTAGKVRLIDFDDLTSNDWLAVRQFVVVSGQIKRRPDVVIFVNGLPLVVIELKAPSSENASLIGAFNQLQTYKLQISALFRTNAFLVTSDGLSARIGSLSADLERFMPWRTVDGQEIAPLGTPELTTLIDGVLDQSRLLELLRNFTVFGKTSGGLNKIVAGYHQFHAVKKAVASTLRASSTSKVAPSSTHDLTNVANQASGNHKAGVIWHTQGSGKSLLMAFYAGVLVVEPQMANPTLIVLTDRNDLDDQLFATFAMCEDLIRQTPVQAESRKHLRTLLSRASGGVIFTTLQKFSPPATETDYSPLTNRSNIVVIADEAHRSQYGFKAKFASKTGEIAYGFAKHLRDAVPNASFIGFTGTPIEATDVNTPAVFGDYIDIYDISRAVEDGATVPIYYESRLARIELDENETPHIDEEIEALLEDEEESDAERTKQKWSTVEALVGSEKRLTLVATDLVHHFEDRIAALDGKAIIVCMSRKICIDLYDSIVKLRPSWHSTDDNAGTIKIVMTGNASDPAEWQQHIGNNARRDLLAKRARDASNSLNLVIVCDMWLTGFDSPSMHTMYIDKPMRGHGLMQAVARVNRVYRDKPGGLIVDYIGIAQNLKSALAQYSKPDQDKTGINEAEAIAVMQEKYEVVRDMFHGFDYRTVLDGSPSERLKMMAGAIEWILNKQQQWASVEKTHEAKRKAQRRFADSVLALSKSFALAASSDEARVIREEVGFFQAIRIALVKTASGTGVLKQDRELAIQQIVSRSVVSTEIVDILAAAGLQTPDISILSDEFLAEIQQMDKKNLGLEALRKLLNDSIRSRTRTNVVETRAFSERLEDAISRYHANAITTAEVLQQLINLARDIRAARSRGEEQGLSDEEIAFYDALAENESALQVMGDEKLRLIAYELLVSLRENVSVDWAHRESARARLRVLVKRILRKYGYPPDLQDVAVQTVLQQAEALSSTWSHN
ncbi:type I restriction endonuclease subunit R [Pseudomonas sp.]|mgnify:FL=1|uniref:type I restriction endonuclease subunit R n=1 Tax=Pseudomonas sp. TaxID=306 RepID=UPI003FD85213